MVETWLTNQVVAVLVMILAVLGLISAPIAVYQHFEIAGFPPFGIEGYQAKLQSSAGDLSRSRANEKTLQASIDKQNKAIKDLGDQDAKRLADAKAAVAAAQADAAASDKKLQAFLAYKPKGATPAEQLLDELGHFQGGLQ